MKTYRGKPRSWWVARRAEHRALWNWLAKTGCFKKYEWPGWEDQGGNVIEESGSCCIACDVVRLLARYSFSCSDCPIVWYYRWCEIEDEDVLTEYKEWCEAPDSKSRSACAAAIRDLPWFFEVAEFTEGG